MPSNYVNAATFEISSLKNLSEYDELIKQAVSEHGYDVSKYEYILLQREFVSKVGYDTLVSNYNSNTNFKVAVDYLMDNVENLRLYIYGGAPNGNYINSLSILGNLLTNYGDDLNDNTTTAHGVAHKKIYQKMMVTLSLTHTSTISFWLPSTGSANPNPNVSLPTTRYEVYRDMLKSNKLDINIFEQLEVEEMRLVLGSYINDDEIKWLRDYTVAKKSLNPYDYMTYVTGMQDVSKYRQDKFFNASNYATYAKKYSLNGYGIANVAYFPKLWMTLEVGGVCWQISNLAENMYVARGIPATLVSQPAHTAYMTYSLENGKGVWTLRNNMAPNGWVGTGRSGFDGTRKGYARRLMNGWGSASWASGNASYMLLGQAAINDYDNYVKAEEIYTLVNIYTDSDTREQILREALNVQSFNLDAWAKLIEVYSKNSAKTENDFVELAREFANNMKYYPIPAKDLLEFIEKNRITKGSAAALAMSNIKANALEAAQTVPNGQVLQATDVRYIANQLLGKIDTTVARFSANTGTISLAAAYSASQVEWEYSIDYGQNWTLVSEGSKKLSDEELDFLYSNFWYGIQIHIIGSDRTPENIYNIEIILGLISKSMYANDRENNIFTMPGDAIVDWLEWRIKGTDKWTLLKNQKPNLTGNKILQVRSAAHDEGNLVYSFSETLEFTFTEDDDLDTTKYIPKNRLSISSYSSASSSGAFAINGYIGNVWQSKSESNSFIVIKLDHSEFISALEYIPNQNLIGNLINGKVYVSMDGTNWTEVASVSDLTNDKEAKMIHFAKVIEGQYVKLEWDHKGKNGVASAAIINLFMDSTKVDHYIEETDYDVTEYTSEDVTANISFTRPVEITKAYLVDGDKQTEVPLSDITKISNKSYSYKFTNNGVLVLEYTVDNGTTATTKIAVDWIDRLEPTVEVTYSKNTITNEDVVATLKFNKKVTILDEHEFTKVSDTEYTYTFKGNDSFKIEFVDHGTKHGFVTLTVNNIDKITPKASVSYEKISNKLTRVTITFSEPVEMHNVPKGFKAVSDTVYVCDFTSNANIILNFNDSAGNKDKLVIKVDDIIEKPSFVKENKPISNKPVIEEPEKEDATPTDTEEPVVLPEEPTNEPNETPISGNVTESVNHFNILNIVLIVISICIVLLIVSYFARNKFKLKKE